jgi:hypothetical protein
MSGIKSNKPSAKGNYRQGYYKIQNVEKYAGDPTQIIYRSSWEHRFCCYCDNSNEIIKWSSEPIGIPYVSPLDNKQHTYYVDFYMRIETEDGTLIDYLVEVKPKASLEKPIMESSKPSVQQLKNYNHSLKTWITNRAKFSAAKQYAENMGYNFIVVTETFLFNKGQ